MVTLLVVAVVLAAVGLGGACYEWSVVDRVWPSQPRLVQPTHGGLRRRDFWIPAHGLFEVVLLTSLFLARAEAAVLWPLAAAFASHATMRAWTFAEFIPTALAFETADVVDEAAARRWTRRSLGRAPLALTTVAATATALVAAARLP